MSAKLFPPFKYVFSHLRYMAAPVEKRDDVAAEIEAEETQQFVDEHPDYHGTPYNAAIMNTWLSLYGLSALKWNLEIAFKDLKQDGLLEIAPPPEAPVLDKWAGVTLSRSDALLEYQPGDDEKESLSKLADDSNLNDHQRKARLSKLRLLAGKQRREFSDLKPGADPAIRV